MLGLFVTCFNLSFASVQTRRLLEAKCIQHLFWDCYGDVVVSYWPFSLSLVLVPVRGLCNKLSRPSFPLMSKLANIIDHNISTLCAAGLHLWLYSYTTSLLNLGLIYAPFLVLPTAAGTCNWAYTKSHFKEISHSFDDRYGCHRSGKKFLKVRESHFIVRENLRLWKKSGKNEILRSTYLLFLLSRCVQVMEILESHEISKIFIFQAVNVILHFIVFEVFTV